MLAILFQLDDKTYAIDSMAVETVVPAIALRKMPGLPKSVKGIYEHHGEIVPVVDLCLAITGRPAKAMLSTRYIICHAGGERLLGLIAEHVIEILDVPNDSLKDPGLFASGAPYLGEVFRNTSGDIIQCVSPQTVLPGDVLASLKLKV